MVFIFANFDDVSFAFFWQKYFMENYTQGFEYVFPAELGFDFSILFVLGFNIDFIYSIDIEVGDLIALEYANFKNNFSFFSLQTHFYFIQHFLFIFKEWVILKIPMLLLFLSKFFNFLFLFKEWVILKIPMFLSFLSKCFYFLFLILKKIITFIIFIKIK